MTTLFFKACSILLLAAAVTHAGELRLEWQEPEKFRDADYTYNGGERSRNIVLNNLEKYFTKEAANRLPEGTVLELRVTQLDLAGDFEPWRGAQFSDVRIVKTLYPAQIDFEYRFLAEDGSVIAEGSERLRDTLVPNSIIASHLARTESYPYVKNLVADWLRKLARNHKG
jgi:hypothetical protein